ncbi:small subunit ribosomal protein S12 [Sarotherodon galilaeus]
MEDDKDSATVEKRQVKPTAKAMEDALQRKIGSRKAKLGQLTEKKNEMLQLMEDDGNVEIVKTKLATEFNHIFGEFCELNTTVKGLFQQAVSGEDMDNDQQHWFEPKADAMRSFVDNVDAWIKEVHQRTKEAKMVDESVQPTDSISVAASRKSRMSKSSTGQSSASSARLKAELEKAALLAQAAALKERRALEEQEAKLKAEKEELELRTALAATDAKLKILQRFEGSDVSHRDDKVSSVQMQPGVQTDHHRAATEDCGGEQNRMPIIQPQSANTVQNISIFSGNPLEYRLFIRAFEHGVEGKTESRKDRLYFLEQYTSGQPRELIRSCLHMDPEKGYCEAKRLLKEHFGNEYRISVAYINKALGWPPIKTEDGEALSALALFLTSCGNAMSDMEYMEELDNVANMRAIVNKLPYKLRARWRSVAFEIEETEARRPKFMDLVKFINTQAKVALHPVFGDIKDSNKAPTKSPPNVTLVRKSGKTIFTTTATPVNHSGSIDAEAKGGKKGLTNPTSAFNKPCLFCHSDHTMAQCKRLRKSLHKEKLEFLREKGLCFSCLKQGHMSRSCEEKLNCELCSLTHPTVLHIRSKDKPAPKEESPEHDEKQSVSSGFVETANTLCSGTGAGDADSILAIVPVQVKAKKGDKAAITYAFLDPGSTATFCTEKLMNELNLSGKKMDILLTTMGQQKTVSSHLVTGLEVSSLENCNFIELQEVFSQVIHSIDDRPYAVKTSLGWTVNGPLRDGNRRAARSKTVTIKSNRISVAKLDDLWKQQLRYDFPECNQEEQLEMSREDLQFMDSVTLSARLVNGHYCIGLPLKNKEIRMPNNRVLAEQRALNLKKRLLKNPTFCEDYSAFMKDLISKGYAAKVPDKDLERSDGKVWYIPHHGVYHPKKHKMRVVFDCGAAYQGFTLNGQLLQGPNLTSTLIGVLTRFRQEPVAVMADVEAMFHQVKVPPEDTDLLRFLWWPNGDLNQALVAYKMVVHLFGATPSPSCASYALRRCAEDNRDQFDSTAIVIILQNFYVDDCLKSVGSEDEAVLLFHNLKAACQMGGFRLTKWISNSRVVLASIPDTERPKEVKDLDLDQDVLPIERALGVQWCVQSDSFKFRIAIQEKQPTRRNILSTASSIYDPLGILAPVVLPAKRILQECCRLKIGWDSVIPQHLAQQWNEWLNDLELLQGFEVTRSFKPAHFGGTSFAQLHHFCDTSEEAYGTVTYLVQKSWNGQVHCSFVMGKARVAPLKHTTIPRLELTAATMAGRMDRMLRKELQIQLAESVFWTDSTAVLKYINNETTRFRTFVANRVSQILKVSVVSQWRHINSHLNPADCVSRGQNVGLFLQNHVWISGPDFLTAPNTSWPKNLDHLEALNPADPEIKKNVSISTFALNKGTDVLEQLIEHYSSWIRLKKAVAWILKDGILRVGGRLSRSALPEEFKHPVILDKSLRVSELILQEIHKEVGHSGRNHVLSKLRQRFWIPGANSAIRKVLSKCTVCRRLHGIVGQQQMGDLPQNRVTPDEPPFTRTGVDYFGPFEVKRGRSTVKRYGVIFTCLAIRAVHLEVAASLDTDSFINALRRFIARRGQVVELRSDNGTNFVSAERELTKAIQEWNTCKIESTLTQKGIKWIFNTPAASHHGGVWERLIKLVRRILSATLKTQNLDEESLQTFLCETEAILNSRPITTPSNDPNDLEALTPNHLLLLKARPSLPPGLFQQEDIYARRRWRQVQYMADLFWKRWVREYLPQLQTRQKWTRVSRNFVPGDIVLLVDETAPRNSWLIGRVTQAMPDEHGLVRRVRVKTKTSELDRPITYEQSSGVKDVLAVPGSIRSSRGVSSLELRLDDGRFQRYHRLSLAQFEDLLSRVGPRIARLDTNYRRSIPPAERLSICLRSLATGDSFRTIAFSFRVGVSTVCQITPQVATAIWDCLVDDFIAVPSPGDWQSITEGFQERWNFPLCCGALDGKHRDRNKKDPAALQSRNKAEEEMLHWRLAWPLQGHQDGQLDRRWTVLGHVPHLPQSCPPLWACKTAQNTKK